MCVVHIECDFDLLAAVGQRASERERESLLDVYSICACRTQSSLCVPQSCVC